MVNRFLLLISIFFSLGIIIGRFFSVIDLKIWGILSAAALTAYLFYFVLAGNEEKKIGSYILGCALFIGAFWFALNQYPAYLHQELQGQEIAGEGTIITYPRDGSYDCSFIVRIDKLTVKNREIHSLDKLLLKVKGADSQNMLPGMTVSFSGVIKKPPGSRNPGDFNYCEYLANKGVFFQVNCRQGDLKAVEKGGSLRKIIAERRYKIQNAVKSLLPERESGLLLGFLFGDTSGIPDDEWEIYQRAGVLHLFSVSGLHVAFMLGTFYFLLSLFTDRQSIRVICGAVVLVLYYFLIGWQVSFVRAAIMVFLSMLALLTGRKKDIYTSIALAVAVILVINPGELFQMGFQMSFTATAGIVYYTPFLLRLGLGRVLSAALAAHLATLPLIMYHFNLISLAAPLLNVFAVAMSTLIASIGLVGACLSCFLPVLAEPFFWAAGGLLYIMSELVLKVASYSWAALIVRSMPLYFIIMLYFFIFCLPHLPRAWPYLRMMALRHKRAAAIIMLVLVLFVSLWPKPARMEVIFLDVGQGDGIFIRTPAGVTMLIDGGGTPGTDYAIGKSVIRPFLFTKGLEKIDLMLMTHNHLDHSEGLLELLSLFKVGCFMMPPAEGNNGIETEIIGTCRANGVPVKELTAGEKVELGKDIYIEVLHPENGEKDIGNNRSLVLRISYLSTSWLLTGDAENKAIAEILASGEKLGANILKLPHHGSISSYNPQFYEAVSPNTVIISAGENSFNQPHPDVVQYFRKHSTTLYVTKENGAVITVSDGKKITVRTVR